MRDEPRKPDFFMVGAPKAGTTSIYNYLVQHPDIFMPSRKEPYFFGQWRRNSEEDLQDYLRLFRGVPEYKAAGEASTPYLYLQSAAEEIKAFRPDAKIIIMLRNPVDRAYSQYWHHVRLGWVDASFEEELAAEEERLRDGWRGFRPDSAPPAYYVEAGRYSKHVERYIRVFGRQQVRVYLFEQLLEDPEGVCRDIFGFLNIVPAYPVTVGKVHNVGGSLKVPALHRFLLSIPMGLKEPIKRKLPDEALARVRSAQEWVVKKNTKTVDSMAQETRVHLQELFRDDIAYTESLIGRDLTRWSPDSP